MRVQEQDNRSMVVFEETDENWFQIYSTDDPVQINGLNRDFLGEIEIKVLTILEEFCIMSSR